MIEDHHNVDIPEAGAEPAFYDGDWERKGRGVLAAGYIVLFGIGTLYFTASQLLSVPIAVAQSILGEMSPEGLDFPEKMSYIFRQMALPIQIMVTVLQFGLFLVPVILLTKKLHTSRVKEYLRYRTVPAIDIIMAVVITVVMMPVTNFIANTITKWLEIPDWIANLGIEIFTARSLPEFIWLAFVIGVTPAVCEEILFRGYAQRTLERKLGVKSVWIVGIIFGLYHFNPIGLVSLALMGVVFGFFFYRSKSIYPSMAAHFTNNTLIVYFLYSGMTIGNIDLATLEAIPAWVAALSAMSSALLLYIYYIMTRGRKDPFPDEEPESEAEIATAP